MVDEFVAQNNGEFIDEDHAYGSQCWDVPARFARVYLGCPYFPTGSGGAEGLYRLFLPPLPQYFDKVSGSDLKKGDTAVWDATFYPPYGHTSLVFAREGNTIWSFEQDGSNDPDGDGNANGVAYLVQRNITSKVNGLRPKGGNYPMPTDAQIDDWISKQHYIGFGVPASPATFKDWGAVLRNNFVDGSISILAGIDTNQGALKNKPPVQPGGNVPAGTYLRVNKSDIVEAK